MAGVDNIKHIITLPSHTIVNCSYSSTIIELIFPLLSHSHLSSPPPSSPLPSLPPLPLSLLLLPPPLPLPNPLLDRLAGLLYLSPGHHSILLDSHPEHHVSHPSLRPLDAVMCHTSSHLLLQRPGASTLDVATWLSGASITLWAPKCPNN